MTGRPVSSAMQLSGARRRAAADGDVAVGLELPGTLPRGVHHLDRVVHHGFGEHARRQAAEPPGGVSA